MFESAPLPSVLGELSQRFGVSVRFGGVSKGRCGCETAFEGRALCRVLSCLNGSIAVG